MKGTFQYLSVMSAKQDFSNRLREAMQWQGYKASATLLEHEFNLRCRDGMGPISTQTAWNWLNGKTIPTHERMMVLANWLDVEPSTLRFGNDSERPQNDSTDRLGIGQIDYLDRQFMEAYLALPAVERRLMQEIVRRFSLAQP